MTLASRSGRATVVFCCDVGSPSRVDSGGKSRILLPHLGVRFNVGTSVTTSASGAKWPWRGLGDSGVGKQGMSLAAKAILQAVAMGVIGWILARYLHHRIMPLVVWTLAVLVLIGGLVYHPLFHAFERFGQQLAKWVAAGLTWGILVPFYYLCFFPGRLILSATGKDPMDRHYPEPDKKTFWVARPPVHSLDQYKKQH